MPKYKATYTDCFGSEETTIHNDGSELWMVVRSVRFEGFDFDSLGPVEGTPKEDLQSFALASSSLCDCELKWSMPIPLATPMGPEVAKLHCSLELGKRRPKPRGGIDKEVLSLRLETSMGDVTSPGTHGFFEDELLEIQAQLPGGVTMQMCFSCQYSDYSPYGNGLFGGMFCFRNLKTEYGVWTDKQAFFELLEKAESGIQETHLCDEFERRKPKTGYRG